MEGNEFEMVETIINKSEIPSVFDVNKMPDFSNKNEVFKTPTDTIKGFDIDKMPDFDRQNTQDLKDYNSYEGGSYGSLKEKGHGYLSDPPQEVHHMPADSVNNLDTNDGPAIAMDKQDHQQTASYGRSKEAIEYRQQQKELIENGKFEEAMQMDIDDIKSKFGNRYDEAIDQMKEYYNNNIKEINA